MQNEIVYLRTESKSELEEILILQKRNSLQNISDSEKISEGFVTVQHSMDTLQKMHNACPHIIAKHKNKVIAYALCMMKQFKNDIPILKPMFTEINNEISEKKLQLRYIVMGQICVDKNYRNQGVFRGLYQTMKNELKDDFDAIITEVDSLNKRSSNAHKAIGFYELKKYSSNNQEWELIMLNT